MYFRLGWSKTASLRRGHVRGRLKGRHGKVWKNNIMLKGIANANSGYWRIREKVDVSGF